MADPTHGNKSDCELLRAAAVTAGIMAAGYFRRSIPVWKKPNASPVSEADLALDDFLRASLTAARPGYGWLSEESIDDPARLERERVFVVDPIDGTGGFLRGEPSWSISLAVVDKGRPVVGVVYAPARDQLFDAFTGGGARLNGRVLAGPTAAARRPLIPAPGAVYRELAAAGLAFDKGPYYPSLAYRLVSVASGHLDAAVARRGAQEWDVAGAAVILAECGVAFEDACGAPLRFNKPNTRHGALAAFAQPSLREALCRALIRVYGCPEA